MSNPGREPLLPNTSVENNHHLVLPPSSSSSSSSSSYSHSSEKGSFLPNDSKSSFISSFLSSSSSSSSSASGSGSGSSSQNKQKRKLFFKYRKGSKNSPPTHEGIGIGGGLKITDLWFDPIKRVYLYVLFICLITYSLNTADRQLIGTTASNMQEDQNWGDGSGHGDDNNHKGTGRKFDMLIGPIYSAVYVPIGIPFGLIADRFTKYRHYMLAMALGLWSLACLCTGWSTEYWQVVCARVVLAFAQAACTPLAGAIIAEFFPKSLRATALGIYNWGSYIGYSLATGVANALTAYAGWRIVWYVFGVAGMLWSIPVALLPQPLKARREALVKAQRGVPVSISVIRAELQSELINNNRDNSQYTHIENNNNNNNNNHHHINQPNNHTNNDHTNNNSPNNSVDLVGFKQVLYYLLGTPSIWLLSLGALIRQLGGLVWAYGGKDFYSNVRKQTNYQQAEFMFWIPVVFGILGTIFGGFISDKFVKQASTARRLIILVGSNLCAAPFAFLSLIAPCPWCYICVIPTYIFGEMWVGIGTAVAAELMPSRMKTTGLAVYFFIIGLAGFFLALITPVCDMFNAGEDERYRRALIVLYPGLYILSSIIFLLAFCTMSRDKRRAQDQDISFEESDQS